MIATSFFRFPPLGPCRRNTTCETLQPCRSNSLSTERLIRNQPRICGSTSAIWPRSTTSARSSISVGSALSTTTFAVRLHPMGSLNDPRPGATDTPDNSNRPSGRWCCLTRLAQHQERSVQHLQVSTRRAHTTNLKMESTLSVAPPRGDLKTKEVHPCSSHRSGSQLRTRGFLPFLQRHFFHPMGRKVFFVLRVRQEALENFDVKYPASPAWQ